MFRLSVLSKQLKAKSQLRMFNSSAVLKQKLYVGNLPWAANEDTLQTVFGAHGELNDAFIVRDRLTGKSRGFGFVEFRVKEEAEAALQTLDGSQYDGRTLRVNLADKKPPQRAPRNEEF